MYRLHETLVIFLVLENHQKVTFSIDVGGTPVVSVTLKAGPCLFEFSEFLNTSFSFCVIEDITVPVDSTGTATFRH